MTTHGTWAALLAGGDGRRLQPLTRSITGDHRPKQFCCLLGKSSLLGETRARVARLVRPERTLFVVTRHHAPFYREELHDTEPWQVVAQPQNRGTLPAVVYTVLRLRSLGVRDGVLGLFPCDHYYRDNVTFAAALAAAYGEARRSPDSVVLLGARASRPETQYGWIEAGPVVSTKPGLAGDTWQFRSVRQFVEKPSESLAAALLTRAGLWNTLVTIGHISALESLVTNARPDLWERASLLGERRGRGSDDSRLSEAVYANIGHADFSRDALSLFPERLRVMVLPDVGWADLGHPDRVADVLADRRHVIHNHSHLAG